MNPRIKTKPTNYSELIELTREDVHEVWLDEKLCGKYVNWMERAIKSTKDPVHFLQYMEYYVEECIFELNNIETPCYQEENFGKAGEQPPVSAQTNNMMYEVIPRLTEYLAHLKPHKSSVFPVNHYFRLILVLCRRCIELDIECFRLLEIIFGFIRKDGGRFYDVCGIPRPAGGYRRTEYEWAPKEYGNGEMASFLRVHELEKLKQETKQQLDELMAKSQQMEEYQEEIEVEVEVEIEEEIEIEEEQIKDDHTDQKEDTNGVSPEEDKDKEKEKEEEEAAPITDETPETETKENDDTEAPTQTEDKKKEEQEPKVVSKKTKTIKRKVMQKEKKMMTKTRKMELNSREKEKVQSLKVSLQHYEAELVVVQTETGKWYYIDSHLDYPTDLYEYCGAKDERSREESWFRVSNINYWGKIGGFATMLKRIAHAKCAVAVSDLVNLIRPVA
eukprot:147348_1